MSPRLGRWSVEGYKQGPPGTDTNEGCTAVSSAHLQPFPSYLDKSFRSSAVFLALSLRSSPGTAPADHCHGQRSKATIVMVVSKQFERVRVEQNHCQGLRMVTINYPRSTLLPPQHVLSRCTPNIPLPRRPGNLPRICESRVSTCRNPRFPLQRPALSWALRSEVPRASGQIDEERMRRGRRICKSQRRGEDVMRIGAGDSIPVNRDAGQRLAR